MTQRERVLRILKEAGEDGVHSFEFYEAGMPRAAARIGELRDAGYTITSTHERYRGDARLGKLKPGVGLVIDLGSVRSVSQTWLSGSGWPTGGLGRAVARRMAGWVRVFASI